MSKTTTIKPLTRFWLALERLPGLAAVEPLWREKLRDDYDLISPLLSPDRELAEVFPRLKGIGDPFRVVQHGPEDIVGVGEEGEEPIKLKRSDLVVHRLVPGRLSREVARVFEIDADFRPVEDLARTYLLGLYRPLAGFEFPAYLTIQLEGSDYRAALERLAARITGPFLFMAPTPQHHRLASKQLLTTRNAAMLALSDTIQCSDSGNWEKSEVAERLLAEFHSWALPRPESAPATFPTPRTARWPDVRIRFLDGHRVSIRVGAATATLTYTEMGMADGRNAEPTKQWELLRDFARERGTITWQSSAASPKNQKRYELLVKQLKSFFRIDGDPITPTADGKGWQVTFNLEPD